jgi:O-antigen ligase
MIVLNFMSSLQKTGLAFASDGSIVYLFGLRTGFSLVIIPGILINILCDYYLNKKQFSIKTIIAICFGIGSILLFWVATGIVEIVIIILFWIYTGGNMKNRQLNVIILLLVILIINFLITVFSVQNNLILLISSLLGKDATFSGRTYIWSRVLLTLSESPLFGYGLDSNVSIYGTLRSAHNQWLHTAMVNGYVGLLILLSGILFSSLQLHKNYGSKIYRLMTIFITATLVACISEIQTYVPFFYILFELPYLLDKTSAPYALVKKVPAT